jgi:hypothetical protein
MYGLEHGLLNNKRERPMFGYGQIADYQNKMREAKKYNDDVDKLISDFFKPKYERPKTNDEEIEMVTFHKGPRK